VLEGKLGRRQLDDGVGQLAVEGILAQAADDDCNDIGSYKSPMMVKK
jgi:hypothetical protein